MILAETNSTIHPDHGQPWQKDTTTHMSTSTVLRDIGKAVVFFDEEDMDNDAWDDCKDFQTIDYRD